ncbi:MAG TPA: SdpI family protein [Anaerolineales bacterium]|nr:SdpI family protein [Anaerolineales bacterium]
MSSRNTILLTLIMILAATLLSLAVYSRLPEQVASHWNSADQVNGTMPRFWGAFMMPLITLAMLGLFLVIPAIDPLKANIARFRGSFNVFIVLIVAFLLYLHVLTTLWNLGFQGFRMSTAMLPAMGLLFIFVGVLLRQAKRNFSIGIRTPWTLSSDTVWDKTHRLGAVLYMASGVIAALGAFFPGPRAYFLVLAPVLASSLILVVYSYILWRAEQTTH